MMGPSPVMVLASSRPVGPRRILKNVASGLNSFKDSRPGCCYTRHAEIDAMNKLLLSYKLKNKKSGRKRIITVNLLVIRVNKDGKLKNSKPCAHCITLLDGMHNHRIKWVYYSNDTGSIIKIRFSDLVRTNHDDGYVTRKWRQ